MENYKSLPISKSEPILRSRAHKMKAGRGPLVKTHRNPTIPPLYKYSPSPFSKVSATSYLSNCILEKTEYLGHLMAIGPDSKEPECPLVRMRVYGCKTQMES